MPPILNDIVVFEDRLQRSGNFWTYMSHRFEAHLAHYLPIFEKYRDDIGMIPSQDDWKLLPFGPFADDNSWKWRRQSLSLFQKLTKGKTFETTLEIGPWNGWLTKYLAKQSKHVVGLDYFTHAYDGIGNINALSGNIIPIQCDVESAGSEFHARSFDLIVINHGLAYSGNPVVYIKGLIPLLKPGGTIVSLGNTWYGNPEDKIHANKMAENHFHQKYGVELYIQPVKGYLDKNDVTLLKDSGFKVVTYPGKILQNFYAGLNGKAPNYIALIYKG